MTQAAIGGPAQTTYRVTSRQGVIGRDAQRVFVVSDGRPAEGGPQQAVYYVSDAEIAAGDFVISGNKPIPIVEVGPVGVEYPPIAVYVVTASSESDFPPQPDPTPPPSGPVPLLDLQADTLSLADGDPVALWADQSANGYDFTASGAARPFKQTVGGKSIVQFNSNSQLAPSSDAQFMIGPNAIDNPASFTIVVAGDLFGGSSDDAVIAKINNTSSGAGWALYQAGNAFLTQEDGGSVYFYLTRHVYVSSNVVILSSDAVTRDELHVYTNGVLDDFIAGLSHAGTVGNISNAEHIRIAALGDDTTSGYCALNLYAVRIYSPALSATDRAAVEAELATRYSITL